MLYAIPVGKPYDSLQKLYFPFAKNVWFCVCTLFVIAVLAIVTLKLTSRKYRNFVIGHSNDMPFFNLVNTCLGGSVPPHGVPSRNFARTIFLIWLLSTFVLRNAYQGKLFDNLRSDQRNEPLYRLKALYESNVKLYLTEGYYQIIADNFPKYKHR